MALLTVENLTFTYPDAPRATVENVSFSLEKGDFSVLCGATGSGKTTLLRLLKRELAPRGTLSGGISLGRLPLSALDAQASASRIGFVMQRPQQQIVTDRVWHELAFGLESLGISPTIMRRRIAEMASYFGIEDWFDRSVSDLSGGQKQILNLASVMVMQPEILLLDEPTAQLDPIAASDFLTTIAKLNRDFSLTVLMIEHRLEEALLLSNKLLLLEKGHLLAAGETRETVAAYRTHPSVAEAMPAAVRLSARFSAETACPLTVREGKRYIEETFHNRARSLPQREPLPPSETVLSFRDVFFRYERNLPDVLRGLSFSVRAGEIFCLLGGNGSGKSTALAAAAGLRPIYSGDIRIYGKKLSAYKNGALYRGCLSLLSQDVETMFLKNTVREELAETGSDPSVLSYDMTPLLDRHPYDLSGGEMQMLALYKVLGNDPRLLLLDEPTKGLDAHAKATFAEILRQLRKKGVTIVLVTHDADFAASCADRCALFFRGEITSVDTPTAFFAGNHFYTTAVNRMTREQYDGIITVPQAEEICRLNGFKEAAE